MIQLCQSIANLRRITPVEIANVVPALRGISDMLRGARQNDGDQGSRKRQRNQAVAQRAAPYVMIREVNVAKYDVKGQKINQVGDGNFLIDRSNNNMTVYVEEALKSASDISDPQIRNAVVKAINQGQQDGDWPKAIDTVDAALSAAKNAGEIAGAVWSAWPVIRSGLRLLTGI